METDRNLCSEKKEASVKEESKSIKGISEALNDEYDGRRHPVDEATCLSFVTFSWMNTFMHQCKKKNGIKRDAISPVSIDESCKKNSRELLRLWENEKLGSPKVPSLARVTWTFCKKRVILTTAAFFTSIVLGFIGPTFFMKRLLNFASETNASRFDGLLWASLFTLAEVLRIGFFTLTWAMSYRTAFRLKTAVMGIIYEKILRLNVPNEAESSKIINILSGDCNRIYEVVTMGQVATGGPLVFILCFAYIVHELGWLSVIGMAIFPLSYPIQYLLVRISSYYKEKAITIKDERVSLISQAATHLKFLKMFSWQEYFHEVISACRLREKKNLIMQQIFLSLSVILAPSLPHVGAIMTFILYLNSGHALLPAQAFCIMAIMNGRVRPTLNTIRSGINCYLESKIVFQRIQCFTVFFMFLLFSYSIRTMRDLYVHSENFKISIKRIEELMGLPETMKLNDIINDANANQNIDNNAISLAIGSIFRESMAKVQPKKRLNKVPLRKKKLLDLHQKQNLLEDQSHSKFSLCDLNFMVAKGAFIGVCGEVGTGKSTFLECLAGSIPLENGHLRISGEVAFVPQKPWIFKGTIRDNILYGEEMDKKWYEETIEVCCLKPDLSILLKGDLTETDGIGSNLSGGQKQRISIARALYHLKGRDIFIFDDPFSSLDHQVANSVYRNAILDIIVKQGKSVVLSTNQVEFLKECDEVIVFGDKTIAERGTPNKLMLVPESHYSRLLSATVSELAQDDDNSNKYDAKGAEVKKEVTTIASRGVDSVIPQTSIRDGKVECAVYQLYVKCAGGIFAVLLVLTTFALSALSTAATSWWLKNWFSVSTFEGQREGNYSEPRQIEMITLNSTDYTFNRDVYAGSIGIIFLASLLRTVTFACVTIKANQILHAKILNKFFSNKLSALQKIGMPHILNLFVRDLGEVDSTLANTMEILLQNFFNILSILLIITWIFTYYFPLFLLLLGALFIKYRRLYDCAIRDLKRMESESRTPVIKTIQESLQGFTTIRAFSKQAMHLSIFREMADWNHSVAYQRCCAVRWLSFRLDMLAVSVTFVTSLLIVLTHGSISAAASGLAISYAAQLSGIFQYTVRLATETEAKFVSVERMRDFMEQNEAEESHKKSPRFMRKFMNHKNCSTSNKWPTEGTIEYRNVSLSYSAEGPLALNNVSFKIKGGQKLGIIGRTGSGKSSIGNALFRINDIKSGSILIDGLHIDLLSLDTLRSALSIIPQDIAFFEKTIRFNLDPACAHTDDAIWKTLEQTQIREAVQSLYSQVELSMGQKQLLSVARAILRNSKILFIDEATSNIDPHTATQIDKLMAEEFKDKTILIVAHRPSALKYCDFVLTMADGAVKQFDRTDALLKKSDINSYFDNPK